MKQIYLIVILLFFHRVQAQLAISSTTSATALSQTISGQGVTILNPTLTCAANQAGIFSGGTASGLGLNSGIILTSGNANGILPPNATSGPGNGATVLPLLSQLAATNGGSTNMFDGCVLTFDVIPTCDSLAIRYIFASTEFPTFVNTAFNDVFGFFVSGPNPGGGNYNNINIATIPGTTTPVTITSVGVVPGAFQLITGLQPNYYFTSNYLASINVVPNQVYTFVLAIADAGDGSLDSSVLLDFAGLYCINPLNISANQQNICSGDSVVLTASGGGPTTNWNIPGNSVQLNPTQYKVFPTTTTTYAISSLTQWGLFTDSVTVTVTPQPSVNIIASKDSICRGETLPLQATGANNFVWTPANVLNNTNSANVLASPQNNTTIFVQGNNGNCIDFDTIFIKVKQLPQTVITMPDFKICSGDTAFIWGVSQNNDQFSWSPNQNLIQHSSGFVNQAGNVKFDSVMVFPTITTYYKLNGSNYCANSFDSVLVRVIPPINLQVNDTDPRVCIGETITLIASGADEFIWSPNIGLNSTSNDTVQISLNQNQTYTLTGIIDFCSDSTKITVRINPKPEIEISEKNPKICDGKNIPILISGADSVYFQPNSAITNITKLGALFSPSATSVFPFSAYNQFGCKADSVVKIDVFPPIEFVLPNDTAICEGDSTINYTIWPSGGNGTAFQYNWFNTNNDIAQFDSSVIFSPKLSKYYVVSITDHCESRPKIDSIFIEVKNKPIVRFNHDLTVCQGEPVNFNNLSDNNHFVMWDFGNGTYSNNKSNIVSYVYALPGIYIPALNIVNEFGCEDRFDSLSIEVTSKPSAGFYLDPATVDLMNPTISFNNLSSSDVVDWQWFINGSLFSTEINTQNTFKDTGFVNVMLIVKNKNGCIDTTYGKAIVKDIERLWIPNAFSPNGDGINDEFFPVGNVIYNGNFELKIFDRLGIEVFITQNIERKWNGSFENKGELLPVGVYVYKLSYFDESRHLKTINGHITLQK